MASAPSVKQLLKKAKSSLDEKLFDQTLTICREILKKDKKNYHAYVFVGVATTAQGDVARAVQGYQRAVKLRPDLPLAYKGLIDALSRTVLKEHCVILARAHRDLAEISTQDRAKSLAKAATLLYRLALDDPEFLTEAIAALRKSTPDDSCSPEIAAEEQTAKIARLLINNIPPQKDKEPREAALSTEPLNHVLDEYEIHLKNRPRYRRDDQVVQVVTERARMRCIRNEDFDANLGVLRAAYAYDEILELAEMDEVTQIIPQERLLASFRHVHLDPAMKRSKRSKCILTAESFRRTGKLEVASHDADAQLLVSPKFPLKKRVDSCTHAFVKAYLHLMRGEYRLASQTALDGIDISTVSTRHKRSQAILKLIHAEASCADRFFEQSLKHFEEVKVYGSSAGDSWIEAAAHQGSVRTATLGYGRASRQATTAVEEAAASSASSFGLVEYIWRDALAGDLDVSRMEELAENIKKECQRDSAPRGHALWEYTLMDSLFVMPLQELASLSKTRLGQMVAVESNASVTGLMRAKSYYMEAASLLRGHTDPLAHLGYVFEKLYHIQKDERMLSRAVRCYEKVTKTDSAHPLASRRLFHLLVRQGYLDDASLVARQAGVTNPRASWAHNALGWSRLRKSRPYEACVAFRDALRSKASENSKEAERCFGTDVGNTAEDNALILDVDSWRGLSSAYVSMGKFAPAEASLTEGLKLLINTPRLYSRSTSMATLSLVRTFVRPLMDAEKALLDLSRRNMTEVAGAMEPLRRSIFSPSLIHYSLSDALLRLAATEWLQGCFSRATRLRQNAGKLVEESVKLFIGFHPEMDATCLLKRQGDVFIELVTEHPEVLSELVEARLIDDALMKALKAYTRAFHTSPWERERVQDVVAAMQRMAAYKKDKRLARDALLLAASSESPSDLVTIALLELAALKSDDAFRTSAFRLASTVFASHHLSPNEIALGSTISSQEYQHDMRFATESAVANVQKNPIDWRGWYAVGKVREADAAKRGWSVNLAISCAEAYWEADRLGAGPAAVRGRLLCSQHLIKHLQHESPESSTYLYQEASACAAYASRAGMEEPATCRDVIDKYNKYVLAQRDPRPSDAASRQDVSFLRNIHLFPFCDIEKNLLQETVR